MKKIILLLIVFFIIKLVAAQQPDLQKIIPVSPEAASLARDINYPVSYNTGLPDITIPLYEIKVGDIDLPINLTYHASGIRVGDAPGWAGLGWTLNAEPAISRSINGKPDEQYYLKNSLASTSKNNSEQRKEYLEDLASGIWDEEPDEFFYKLLGGESGRFYFKINSLTPSTDNNTVTTIPYDPIKINYYNPYSMQIVDDNGLVYKFDSTNGGGGVETTGTPNGAVLMTPIGPTCWKATKIYSPSTKQSVYFSYYPNIANGQIYQERYWSYNEYCKIIDSALHNTPEGLAGVASECLNKYEGLFVNNSYGNPLAYQVTSPQTTYYQVNDDGSLNSSIMADGICSSLLNSASNYNETVTEDKKLKEIDFINGKVIFGVTDIAPVGRRALSTIAVYNKQGALIKKIIFYQSYFPENNGSSPNLANRNRLDSLQIQDNSGNTVQTYKFDYNNSAMPSIGTRSIDYWGYWNGESNSSLIPYMTTSVCKLAITTPSPPPVYTSISFGGADRDADQPNLAAACMLNKISYPSGGYTTFDYEQNTYFERIYNPDNTFYYVSHPVGGVRIKQITNSDGSARKFTYGPDGAGGYVKRIPEPDDFMTESLVYFATTDGIQSFIGAQRERTYSSTSIPDLFFSNGAPVFYDEVTEEKIDRNGQSDGKSIYNYDYNFTYGYYGQSWRVPQTNITDDPRQEWMFGHLLNQRDYSYSNGQYKMVKEDNYVYSNYNSGYFPVGKAYMQKPLQGEWNNYVQFITDRVNYEDYSLYTGASKLTLKETIQYSNNSADSLLARERYFYDNPKDLYTTKIVGYNSKNQILYKTMSHPLDYSTLSSNDDLSAGIEALISANKINLPIESSSYSSNLDSTNKRLLTSEFTSFNKTTLLPNKIYTTDNTAPLTDFAAASVNSGALINDNRYKERISFNQYGTYGNILEQQKTNDVKEVYLWGYNDQYPVAKIVGSDFNTVKAHVDTSVLNNGTEAQIEAQLTSLRNYLKSIPNVQISTYTYAPLIGMTSETDPTGNTTYYEYDSFGRLKDAKDKDGNVVKKYDYHYQGQ